MNADVTHQLTRGRIDFQLATCHAQLRNVYSMPSMGLLAGIGIGAVFAVLFWLLERR